MSSRERLGYAAIGGLLIFGVSFVGARHLRKPAPISIQNVPEVSAPAPVQPATSHEVVVHVAGAVKSPGVIHLKDGARVVDAIHAAGGPLPEADLNQLNLAAKLVDGSQIPVPRKNENRTVAKAPSTHRRATPKPSIDKSGYFAPVTIPPEYMPKPSGTVVASKEQPAAEAPSVKQAGGEVNINTADLNALQDLPGVGASTAKRILDYRTEHGSFSSVDELLAVKGIGPKKLEKMRPFVKL